ncbi:O-antigen/teichoic acid export membrane protein [Filimonas zeae]|uniref:Polysaccharide biosynthesis protein n=2 Tax=Filimonas zeae TaxID=1737353 RepID=A0A917J2J8_9BACT|nr:O-antigen/teichoic acid export membrane protein [Filimonas zeae]GGH76776.1 polysaccharide biosynthesis protein [Filimonas zeae]
MASRFLTYLLTPYLTGKLSVALYGDMSLVYAAIPFLNVIFTYGLETAFFRYAQKEGKPDEVYNTLMMSMLVSTVILSALLLLNAGHLAQLLRMEEHPEYLRWCTYIIALDALATLPFARLRQEGRPVRYAVIRITGVLVNIGMVYFFLSVCPRLVSQPGGSFVSLFFRPDNGVGYIIIANLIQAAVTLVMLYKQLAQFKFSFNARLWKEIMIYSLPLTVAGFGGMINETFDRIMLNWWAPGSTELAAKVQVGIYSANYKLSILITLFITAFRMGAEPFFFKQAGEGNAPRTYARIMKFFVITITLMFLFVALYLDIWKHFIRNKDMWVGLKVVPILLFANMFLGIYYNLSIWYKLSGRTMAGAWITLIGAAVTLAINAAFIPFFSYMACAWATCLCYGTMMVISFIWGQKAYPVPYAWKKLVAYMVIVLVLFLIHKGLTLLWSSTIFSLVLATLFMGAYALFIIKIERKEFGKLPVIGKYI